MAYGSQRSRIFVSFGAREFMNRKTTEIDKIAAAYLAGHEGTKQTAIAQILGISQTVVSRMLEETKDVYWRERTEFISDGLDRAKMHTVLQRVGKNKLTEAISEEVGRRFGKAKQAPVLRVFSSGRKNAPSEQVAEFAKNSASYVLELLLRSRSCGLTWGGVLWHLMNALGGLTVNADGRTIECIPLSGEPLGNNPVAFSSSSLTAELGRILNGAAYNARSIAMVPAFIPDGFSAAELRGVWKLIELVPSYNEIFGARGQAKSKIKSPLADSLDMILTSVGPANKVLGFGAGRLFETGRVTIERLQQLVTGDIGGVCFPRPNLNPAEARDLKSVQDRWTGLTLAQLEACAAAANHERPGVVVVCAGGERASFIYELLGWMNHLIIDDRLALALEERLAG